MRKVARVYREHGACNLEGEIVCICAVEGCAGTTERCHDVVDDISGAADERVPLVEL